MIEGPTPSVAEVQAMLEAAWPDGLPDFKNMPDNGIVDYIDIMKPANHELLSEDLYKALRALAMKKNITIVTSKFSENA